MKDYELSYGEAAVFTIGHTKAGRPRNLRAWVNEQGKLVVNGDVAIAVEPTAHNNVMIQLIGVKPCQ